MVGKVSPRNIFRKREPPACRLSDLTIRLRDAPPRRTVTPRGWRSSRPPAPNGPRGRSACGYVRPHRDGRCSAARVPPPATASRQTEPQPCASRPSMQTRWKVQQSQRLSRTRTRRATARRRAPSRAHERRTVRERSGRQGKWKRGGRRNPSSSWPWSCLLGKGSSGHPFEHLYE